MGEQSRADWFVEGVEVREGAGGVSILGGYAAVFNQETVINAPGGVRWRERIGPGAFADSLGRDDVIAAVNHDHNQVLGRTKAGNVTLKTDARGLRYDITLPNTSLARDTVENVRAGILVGSSFKFSVKTDGIRVVKEQGRSADDLPLIVLERVTLIDVGPVVFPAYEGTSVSMRSSMSESVMALVRLAGIDDQVDIRDRQKARLYIARARAWGR